MNIVVLILIVLLNFLIESVILVRLPILGIVANSSVTVLAALLLLGKKNYARYTGLAMGLIQDIVFSPIVGINALIYYLLGLIFEHTDRRSIRGKFFAPIFLSIVMLILYNVMYIIMMYFTSNYIDVGYYIKNIALIEALYTSVISIPVYKLISKIYNPPQDMFVRE